MKLSTKAMLFGTALALSSAFGAMAQEALTKDNLRSTLEAQLGTTITSAEIKYGLSQVKVEAVNADGTKTETIYSVGDGGVLTVLKTETEAAEAEDLGKTGIETKSITKDFEEGDDNSGKDDDENDDENDDDGSDDDGSDDDGSDDDSGDDDSGDDDSGDDSDSGSDHD